MEYLFSVLIIIAVMNYLLKLSAKYYLDSVFEDPTMRTNLI